MNCKAVFLSCCKLFAQVNANGYIFLCQERKTIKKNNKKNAWAFSNLSLQSVGWAACFFLWYCVSLFSLMDCKKTKCNHKSAKYLEMPNGILVSFLFPCALSPRKGMLRVSFLLFIGVLLRHTSCLFCMVFAKMPLAWGNLLPSFRLQLWTSRGFFPSLPWSSFLNSIFCMLHL